jgi:Fic family protein
LPVPWNEDNPADLPVIAENLRRLLRRLVDEAPLRRQPSVAMAQDWHRAIYRGARLPVPYYAGEVRNSDPRFPELYGYEVEVGARPGVPSATVPRELDRFEEAMREVVGRLDPVLGAGVLPAEIGELHSILTLCAHGHGEWVRIHPFANGNGRTARIWANWCALRYGLPPFVRLRPRPAADRYALAAADSMLGDHRAMVSAMAMLLEEHLRTGPLSDG